MKLAIIGIRYTDPVNKIVFNDYRLVESTIFNWFNRENLFIFDEIISGGAIGADSLGAKFADDYGIKKTIFLPDWEKHGKKAGFVRNRDIIENSDFVLAFWSRNKDEGKGTANSLGIARELGKPTLIIYV